MQVKSVHKSTFFFESSGTGKYRYGFNGMEKDDNLKGTGNSYDFGARMQDSRLGRWFVLDPLSSNSTGLGPYTYANSTPIQASDPDGKRTIFVNGYYNNATTGIKGYIARTFIGTKKGKDYWGEGFVDKAKEFLNDANFGTKFVDGRGKATSTAKERLDAGYSYAKSHFEILTDGMVKDENGKFIETMKVVTHSQGGAYGEGIIKYLEEQGVPVETVIHFSVKQAEGFTASQKPTTFQIGIEGDLVVDVDTKIKGVDNFAVVSLPEKTWAEISGAHAKTKGFGGDLSIFDNLEDLKNAKITPTKFEGFKSGIDRPSLNVPPKKIDLITNTKNGTTFKKIEKE